jgi:myosin heavy subunit
MVDIINGPVTNAFKMFMDIIRGFAKGLAQFSDKMFGTKLAQLFETPEDIKTNVADMGKDIDKLQSQLKQETELRQNYLAATEKYNQKDKEVQEAKLAYAEMRKKGIGGDEAIAAQKKIEQLEKERSELSTKKYNLGRELERQGSMSTVKTEESTKIEKDLKEAKEAYAKMTKSGATKEQTSDLESYIKDLEKRLVTEGKTATQVRLEKQLSEIEEKRNKRLSELAQKESEFGTNLGAKATSKEVVPSPVSSGGGRGSAASYGVKSAVAGEGVDVAGSNVDMTQYLKKIAMVESGGKADAKAKTSSASGLFQFTEGTWNQMTKQMGKNYTLQDRFDPKKAAEVAAYFTSQQKSQLEKGTGQSASESDLYMAHFLGAAGATKFLNALRANPDGPASEGADPKQVQANASIFYDKKGDIRSLQQVYDLMSNKVSKAGEQVASGKVSKDIQEIQVPEVKTANSGGRFSGPDSGYLVMLHGNEDVVPRSDTQGQVTKEALSTSNSQDMGAFMDMVAMLTDKLDDMVNILSDSKDVQDKLLQYSRV